MFARDKWSYEERYKLGTLRNFFISSGGKYRYGRQWRTKYLGDKIADGFFGEKRMLEKCDAFFYMHARKEDYALPRYNTIVRS